VDLHPEAAACDVITVLMVVRMVATMWQLEAE
jgi:hypothetical protein